MRAQAHTLMTVVLFVLLASLTALPSGWPQSVNEITYITENYPPYNYEQGGIARGFAVDCLLLMLEKLNSTVTRQDIRVFPWARGYHQIQTTPNTCLFTMTRTDQREHLFKWVGWGWRREK